jgi:AraC-like DNA-binding protein
MAALADVAAPPPAGDAGATRVQRLMWVTPARVFYAGLLGAPSVRRLGSITVYTALDGPIRLRLGGGAWQSGALAVVQPYTAHEVACDARHVIVASIEPETVDAASLPPPLGAASGLPAAPALSARLREVHARLWSAPGGTGRTPLGFDAMVFGRTLAPRQLDPRIAAVLDALRRDPATPDRAADLAAAAGLSTSRFLHLFSAEVGTPLRRLRGWKRARSLLQHVRRDARLVHVALDTGYPDATHFSHSIRQVYGLKPSDIVAGSRRLRLIDTPGVADG